MRISFPLFAGETRQTAPKQAPVPPSSPYFASKAIAVAARKPLTSDSFTSRQPHFGTGHPSTPPGYVRVPTPDGYTRDPHNPNRILDVYGNGYDYAKYIHQNTDTQAGYFDDAPMSEDTRAYSTFDLTNPPDFASQLETILEDAEENPDLHARLTKVVNSKKGQEYAAKHPKKFMDIVKTTVDKATGMHASTASRSENSCDREANNYLTRMLKAHKLEEKSSSSSSSSSSSQKGSSSK